jgi:DNA-binding helix-hairpin-helix protein with protein kinase domain
MPNYRDSQGKTITLNKEINRSGEGVIWTTNQQGLLAKIYHQSTQERIDKLQVMVKNPPDDPTAKQGHISIAWPKELIYDHGKIIGFLMPEIKNAKELLYVYNPKYRKQHLPQANWYVLHIIAGNLASIIQALHVKGYIVGDMKTQNILVNNQGMVSIIDTDSFQVKDIHNNRVYRCPVASEGFTPPELIGKKLKELTQTRYHDRFRLAIIIHQLLFSYHPFMGKWTGSGDPPGMDDSISSGHWLYGTNSLLKPTINNLALDILHPELKKCFLKCLNDGHNDAIKRPSPEDWVNALTLAINHLTVCNHNNNHIYSDHYGKCIWCERLNTLKVDAFPKINNPLHPQKISQQIPVQHPRQPQPQPQPPQPKPPQPQLQNIYQPSVKHPVKPTTWGGKIWAFIKKIGVDCVNIIKRFFR